VSTELTRRKAAVQNRIIYRSYYKRKQAGGDTAGEMVGVTLRITGGGKTVQPRLRENRSVPKVEDAARADKEKEGAGTERFKRGRKKRSITG